MEEISLKENEYHPAADSAMEWYRNIKYQDMHAYSIAIESLASTALSGNRLAELCMSTINRLDKGEPVSDRYLLGLCWTLQELLNKKV